MTTMTTKTRGCPNGFHALAAGIQKYLNDNEILILQIVKKKKISPHILFLCMTCIPMI